MGGPLIDLINCDQLPAGCSAGAEAGEIKYVISPF